MSEQPAPHDVVFYCDPCARRSGRRRLLAAADRDAATSDGWRFWLARRGGRKVMVPLYNGRQVPAVALVTPTIGGHLHGPRQRIGPVLQLGGHRFVLVPFDVAAPAAQLICYRNVPKGQRPHRPRVARTTLVELAERAVAYGRRDAYV
jgi:hypothetical protein